MGDHPLRPPTDRSLGKPLPYQQTNRTHAHLLPSKLSSIYQEIIRSYGVLIKISLGYPPVKGRLHTCYSPVRRSSAGCKHPLLPLDLHVLGLPLAFILSQDQTLRCSFLNNLTTFKIDFVSKWYNYALVSFKIRAVIFYYIFSMNLTLILNLKSKI